MTTLTQAEKQFLLDHSRTDPAWFWDGVLGCPSVYDKQLEMVRAVRDHNRVAVVGANGTGKDWQSARPMLWWMATRYPAICVVLGPTHRQVSDIVWKEARSAYLTARMALGGQMYRTARWEVDDRHYAVGFATDNEYNIQGFHSPNLLVILTEAHNIEQSHIDAVKRLNPARMLLTGNAFASSGEFYDAFHGGSDLYHTIEIAAGDTPNIQQNREIIPGMVPDARRFPSGCRFNLRCPLAEARCQREEPVLEEREEGHWVSCWSTEALPAERADTHGTAIAHE